MGFGLLDVYHSQGKSMDGMEVKNRHKLGGLKLDKIRLLSLVSHRKRLRVFGLQRQKLFHKRLRPKIANLKELYRVYPLRDSKVKGLKQAGRK